MIAHLKERQTHLALLRGLGVVAGIYILVFVVLIIRGDAIINNIEDDLPQRLVSVSVPAIQQEKPYERPTIGQQEEGLFLPSMTEDGLSYFKAFRQNTTLNNDTKAVSIVITGLHSGNIEMLESLPPEIAVALSPYDRDVMSLEKTLQAQGREIWIDLPMEHDAYGSAVIDPGPRGILSRQSLAATQENMHWTMDRGRNYIGLTVHSSERFSKNQPVMRTVLQDIFGRGLGIIELNPQGLSYFEQNAALMNAPYSRAAINLNNPAWLTKRQDALNNAAKLAQENGQVLMIVPAFPAMIEDVVRWIETFETEGLTLTHSSAIATRGISDDNLFQPVNP